MANTNATPIRPNPADQAGKAEAKPATKPAEPQLYEMTDASNKTRLVEATNPVQAIMHVFRPNCRRIKPLELAKLLKSGIEIEVATGA